MIVLDSSSFLIDLCIIGMIEMIGLFLFIFVWVVRSAMMRCEDVKMRCEDVKMRCENDLKIKM